MKAWPLDARGPTDHPRLMRLSSPKTIAAQLRAPMSPPAHVAILRTWSEMIRMAAIERHSEVNLHSTFAPQTVEGMLGYRGSAAGNDQTVSAEQSILKGSVDLALGRFGGGILHILAPFELKGADIRDPDAIMPGRGKTPVQRAWDYAVGVPGGEVGARLEHDQASALRVRRRGGGPRELRARAPDRARGVRAAHAAAVSRPAARRPHRSAARREPQGRPLRRLQDPAGRSDRRHRRGGARGRSA